MSLNVHSEEKDLLPGLRFTVHAVFQKEEMAKSQDFVQLFSHSEWDKKK